MYLKRRGDINAKKCLLNDDFSNNITNTTEIFELALVKDSLLRLEVFNICVFMEENCS